MENNFYCVLPNGQTIEQCFDHASVSVHYYKERKGIYLIINPAKRDGIFWKELAMWRTPNPFIRIANMERKNQKRIDVAISFVKEHLETITDLYADDVTGRIVKDYMERNFYGC